MAENECPARDRLVAKINERIPRDHWKIGENMCFRVHLEPRRSMFDPKSESFPGDLSKIGFWRETHRHFQDGTSDVVQDEWGLVQQANEVTNLPWTGFTMFRARSANPVDLSSLPKINHEDPQYRAFVADRFGAEVESQAGKKPRKINVNKCEEHVREGVQGSRKDEWGKYQCYNAAMPI